MEIQNKVKKLLVLRTKADKAEEVLKEIKLQKTELQQSIIDELKANGLSSVKTDKATIAKTVSKRLVIDDESKLIADLKERKLNDYVKEQVDKSLFLSFSREAIKQNINLKGTSVSESEYISVRINKQK